MIGKLAIAIRRGASRNYEFAERLDRHAYSQDSVVRYESKVLGERERSEFDRVYGGYADFLNDVERHTGMLLRKLDATEAKKGRFSV